MASPRTLPVRRQSWQVSPRRWPNICQTGGGRGGRPPPTGVLAATLAQAGALAEAAAVAGAGGEVFPLFMAGGWFTRIHIPKRLADAGAVGWRGLGPFGCDPALPDPAATLVAEALP